MSLSQYATAHGYRLTTDILICVFNKSTNTYEYTVSASDIGRVAAEVADLEELNLFYDFVVDGKQQQWISVNAEEMADYVIDIICESYDRG